MLKKGCFIRACYSIVNKDLNKQIRQVNPHHSGVKEAADDVDALVNVAIQVIHVEFGHQMCQRSHFQ
jgi:hypothetical protein